MSVHATHFAIRDKEFTDRSVPHIGMEMPTPPEPPDLTWCIRCRKVIGPHKGWFGGECQCNAPKAKPRAGPAGPWGTSDNLAPTLKTNEDQAGIDFPGG